MKIATYDTGTGPRAGVIVDDGVIDVSMLLGTDNVVSDVRALLELPDTPLDRLRDALSSGAVAPSVPLSSVRLLAPVLQPPTVRDFFAFEAHAKHYVPELPEAWYQFPVYYFTSPLRISGPDAEVAYPSASDKLDYEVELGAIIGRDGTNVSEADALSYIAGFTIFNDWSARDLQAEEMPVGTGAVKGKDFATTLGPWMVTTDELEPYMRDGRLDVRCTVKVNGDLWGDGQGGTMHYTWGQFIERASRDSRIAAGDVLGSGTVGGCSIGEAIAAERPNAHFLLPGDVVEMEIEGIGILRNTLGPKVYPDAS